MGVVEVFYEVYRCPHCGGFIVIREQYRCMEDGCSISVEHMVELPEYLLGERVFEMESAI